MKRGDRFIHAYWIDEQRRPLICEVTAVRNDVVYWRGVGDGGKGKYYFHIKDAHNRVKAMILPSEEVVDRLQQKWPARH